MKKALLILGLLFGFCLFSKAQFKEIAAGPEFNEPHSEHSTFLLMKKGNLVFAEVGFKDSIRVRIYNTSHQEIAVTSYAMSSPAKRKYLGLSEAFEINREIILFINTEEENAKILYRIIIDPNSGQVKKEEKLFELKPETKKEMFALDLGKYYVSKATDGDNYAITFCNNFRSEKIKKIETVLFNKEHAEISRSFYETVEKEFDYLHLLGMKVFDTEKVAILLVGHVWKGGGPKMFLGLTKKGASVTSVNVLDFPGEGEYSPANAKMDYDKFSNRIIVATDLGKYLNLGQYICFLDPQTGKTEKLMKFNFSDAILEKGKQMHGKRYDFFGKPVTLLPGKNGTFSVVYEENETVTSDGPGAKIGDFSFTKYTYGFTLNIVVADFDKNGKLVDNYLIPKKFLLDHPTTSSYRGGFANHYRRFAYINSSGKGYLFINDKRENIGRIQENKDPKQVDWLHTCDAFYFPLAGNEAIPARKYLYRETNENEEHIQSSFGVFTYDKENDVFITLRLNRDTQKRTKTANVVWLKPQ